ncbi:MAG: keto-deoxy-phosphogluconate aldolase [Verrucomicrobia bacterium 61-8]|nr:bifunctional 4-hydroxy-2-oxoglutarate aldolase/2-dehydro-3-deoxy-phosphogluconate aldolase [Verrucomicrobiota bacterium]OJV18114.1 MAG: keto-deoxy-phosphogluconate aldolase [Verrucomicrobia bacterium 61-8]
MSVAFDPSLAAKIEKCGIIAVLIIDRVDDAVPLARALLAGGVNVMELTLRTPAAIDALKAITAEVPEMVAGVGTVLTPEQAKLAKESGAAFAVAPGFNPRVLAAAREQGISFAPGVLTPTDIELAVEGGCKLLKLFPAEPSGGLKYLKAVAAPYAHLGLKYIPLGGLNSANMGSYIADPLVAALGGSWLAPKDLIKAGKWDEITRLAKESTGIIASTPRS